MISEEQCKVWKLIFQKSRTLKRDSTYFIQIATQLKLLQLLRRCMTVPLEVVVTSPSSIIRTQKEVSDKFN